MSEIRIKSNFRLCANENKNLILLASAQATSILGDQIFKIALIWFSYTLGGAALLATIVSIQSIFLMIMVLLGGSVSKLFNAKKIMVLADFIRCGVCVIIGGFIFFNWTNTIILIALAIIFGTLEAFFMPAFSIVFKSSIRQEGYGRGNSIMMIIRQCMNIIGPVIGGICVTFVGVYASFILNGVSFAISACLVMLVKNLDKNSDENINRKVEFKLIKIVKEIAEDLKESYKVIIKIRWLIVGICITTVVTPLQQALSSVVVPVYLLEKFNKSIFSIVLSSYSIGALIGSVLFMCFISKRKYKILLPFMYMLFAYVSYGMLGFIKSANFAYVSSFITGCFMTIFSISWNTYVMSNVSKEQISHVTSLSWFSFSSLIPVAIAICGVWVKDFGAEKVIKVIPISIIIFVIIMMALIKFITVPKEKSTEN